MTTQQSEMEAQNFSSERDLTIAECDLLSEALDASFQLALRNPRSERKPEKGGGPLSQEILEFTNLLSAALLANNPNLERSFEIERAKNECIRTLLCNPDEESSWTPGPSGEE